MTDRRLVLKAIYTGFIRDELDRATELHPAFPTMHHGYAVILEELEELWQAIKYQATDDMRKEAIQVGAMALRFLIDIVALPEPFTTGQELEPDQKE